MMFSRSEVTEACARDAIDLGFPSDPIAFFRRHGFSGQKRPLPASRAEQLARELWQAHADRAATVPASLPFLAKLPWPITTLPDSIIRGLGLASLAPLAEELLGAPARVFSWQAFARTGGEPATGLHEDGHFVPIAGPGVAFWIPVTPTPERSGLVMVADVDGTGPRPVRHVDQDPGDLTWHDLEIPHWAESMPVDFIALGFGVYPDGALLDTTGPDPLDKIRMVVASRVFPGVTSGHLAVSDHTPFISDLPA